LICPHKTRCPCQESPHETYIYRKNLFCLTTCVPDKQWAAGTHWALSNRVRLYSMQLATQDSTMMLKIATYFHNQL